jgi:hypothetical protein
VNFPSGIPVTIPGELLLSGRSGAAQVTAPEQPVPLSRMTDEQLTRFAADMIALLESESRDESDTRLVEYIDLLSLQCEREIMRRIF